MGTTAISAIRCTNELKEYLQAQGLNLIASTVFQFSAMSIGTTAKLFFHNSQLLLYTKRFWFSLALNWFSLILNLKMLLQVTIRSIIQGKVTSAWGQGKHHSYIPCYCKMCCESIENMLSFPMLKEDHATIWLNSCWTAKLLRPFCLPLLPFLF